MQILLNKSRYLEPKMLRSMQISMTHQNISTVCHALGTKSSFQRLIALKINCAPEKLIDVVTVQLPTRVNLTEVSRCRQLDTNEKGCCSVKAYGGTHQPVIQELNRAYFLVLSIAAQ